MSLGTVIEPPLPTVTNSPMSEMVRVYAEVLAAPADGMLRRLPTPSDEVVNVPVVPVTVVMLAEVELRVVMLADVLANVVIVAEVTAKSPIVTASGS